jgi:hypothetical protein
MRIAARYYDPAGTEFTFDNVFYDSVGNVFLDEQKKIPIPFYLPDENASFDRYEIEDLPQGLRSVDAENILYRMRALLRCPVRPAEKPPVHLVNRPTTLREQAFELQTQPLNVVQQGVETGARAYQRAADERANQVERLMDAERRQQVADSWKTVSKDQQALNMAAAAAKRQWIETKNKQFAAQNGGHVLGNDGRATKD